MDSKDYEDILNKLHILEQKVYQDSLTGLYNRRFYDEMAFFGLNASSTLQTLGFIMADVEKFKQINDIYGHLTGDDCLQKIALVFQQNTADCDAVIRYGGDEFLLILKDRTEPQLAALVPFLKSQIQQIQIPGLDALHLNINMGYSFSSTPKVDKNYFNCLLRIADERMYKEKTL